MTVYGQASCTEPLAEQVQDCFHLLPVEKSHREMSKVYLGTCYTSFKQRVVFNSLLLVQLPVSIFLYSVLHHVVFFLLHCGPSTAKSRKLACGLDGIDCLSVKVRSSDFP